MLLLTPRLRLRLSEQQMADDTVGGCTRAIPVHSINTPHTSSSSSLQQQYACMYGTVTDAEE